MVNTIQSRQKSILFAIKKHVHKVLGVNSRLNTVELVILEVKLKHLDE
jgi:dTDP-4-amino-4,6-dideoxygalactose transaminase